MAKSKATFTNDGATGKKMTRKRRRQCNAVFFLSGAMILCECVCVMFNFWFGKGWHRCFLWRSATEQIDKITSNCHHYSTNSSYGAQVVASHASNTESEKKNGRKHIQNTSVEEGIRNREKQSGKQNIYRYIP